MKDGKIVEIGKISADAYKIIDASGAVVTPGFVDLHTHSDGQISWDEELRPSVNHGVTTAVMGNCGVGFAPVRPGTETYLINLMEGVEDIPETVLAEGIDFGASIAFGTGDWDPCSVYATSLFGPEVFRVGVGVRGL